MSRNGNAPRVLTAVDISKSFKQFRAVDHLNISVFQGEIYGLLGPNGAGKTTTLRVLLGLTAPDAGTIQLFDEPFGPGVLKQRARIGYVPERDPLGVWPWMTGWEYLQFFGALYQIEDPELRINQLVERVKLESAIYRPVSEYSHGMHRKISIVRALLHDPELLVLDEPISGLDPVAVKDVRDLILFHKNDNRTIIISSHVLSEMERLCDRAAILSNGWVVAEDDLDSLAPNTSGTRQVRIEVEEIPENVLAGLNELPFVNDATEDKQILIVSVETDRDHRRELSEFLYRHGVVPLTIRYETSDLESTLITITNDRASRIAEGGPLQ